MGFRSPAQALAASGGSEPRGSVELGQFDQNIGNHDLGNDFVSDPDIVESIGDKAGRIELAE
jgi:hypothetical protein